MADEYKRYGYDPYTVLLNGLSPLDLVGNQSGDVKQVYNFIVPRLGENEKNIRIVKWFKGIGEAIIADETIVELETDHACFELPSGVSGILQEKLYEVGSTVSEGSLIARIAHKMRTPEASCKSNSNFKSTSDDFLKDEDFD